MVKVTPYVSPCRKQEDPSYKKLHLRISRPRTETTETVAEKLEHGTGLTKTDIVSVLTGLRDHIIAALSEGCSVQLDGLGRISLIPHFTKPVYEGDKISNRDIGTKGVQFLPDREMIKKVRFITRYEAEGLHRPKDVTPEEALAFCEEWFAGHEVLLTTDMMAALEINRPKAQRLLKAFVEQGVLTVRRFGTFMQYRRVPQPLPVKVASGTLPPLPC